LRPSLTQRRSLDIGVFADKYRRGVCGRLKGEEVAHEEDASANGQRRAAGTAMSSLFVPLRRWFADEERTVCPFCRTKQAIDGGSLLVCLACEAVSIVEREYAHPHAGKRVEG
jgi:hypothetical protein